MAKPKAPFDVHTTIRPTWQVALALAIAGSASAPALAETLTYSLGDPGHGTTIWAPDGGSLNELVWVPKGMFPVNTKLTSVTVNATLDAGSQDNWASDLTFYLSPLGGQDARLQIGGYSDVGNPITRLWWANGDDQVGATVSDTKNAPADFPSGIDLHDYQVSLINGYAGWATWSGMISFNYAPPPVYPPGTCTWDGGLTGTWDTTSIKWLVPPGTSGRWTNGSTAIFSTGGSTITIIEAGINAVGLNFTAATTIAGGGSNTLGLSGAANVSSTSNVTATISAPITGSAGLVKSDAGGLVLSGTSTYTGTTYVKGGALTIANGGVIGAGAMLISANDPLAGSSRFVVGNAAGSVSKTVGTVTLAGEGRITSAATSATLTSTGSFEMQRGFVNAPVSLAGSGIALNKTTSDLVILGGGNTYTGTTTVAGGILRLGHATAIPGGIGASGGTSHLAITAGTVELANGGFSRPLGSGAAAFEIVGGTGGFSSSGADRTVTVGGNAGAVVTWGSPYFNPAALILNDATGSAITTFANPLDVNGATRTIAVNSPTTTSTGTRAGRLAGVVQGSGGLTKVGVGALILAGANTYDGLTTVGAGGIVSVQHQDGLGATSAGTVVQAGAQLQIQPPAGSGATGLTVGTEPLAISGTGLVNNGMNVVTASPTNPVNGFPQIFTPTAATVNASNSGALRSISGSNTYGGVVTLAADALVSVDAGSLALAAGVTGSDRNLTVSLAPGAAASTTAITTGSGGLTLIGRTPGAATAADTTFTLTGASTYTGATTIRGGTLSLAPGAALNGATGTPLAFTGSGTFLVSDVPYDVVTMGRLAVTSGDGTVSGVFTRQDALSAMVVAFSDLTHAAGSTVTFTNQGGARSTDMFSYGNVITVGGQTTGFMGPWAFYGSTADIRMLPSGSGYAWYDANGFVRDYRSTDPGYVAVPASNAGMGGVGATSNAVLGGSVTGQTTASVNTVNLGANNFAMASDTDVLSVAGVLSSGAGAATFAGGRLRPAAAGGELVLRVDRPSDTLTVSSLIQDNSSASSLTKSGAGTLAIASAPTYTGTTTVANGILHFQTLTAGAVGSRAIVVDGAELQTGDYFVGGNVADGGDADRAVAIRNGGNWSGMTQLHVGYGPNADNDSVVVDGVGSQVATSGDGSGLFVGTSGSGNSLTISNGGFVFNNGGAGTTSIMVGENAGADGNSITVTGAGSTLSQGGQRLFVGVLGGTQAAPNTMTIGDGGQVICRAGHVGNNQVGRASGSFNRVTVSGANSLWSVTEGLTVGKGNGTNNGVLVAAGGTLYATAPGGQRIVEVGSSSGSAGNSITVTGSGSKFIADPVNSSGTSDTGAMTASIGLDVAASGNHVDVLDGGYWAMNWALEMGGVDSAINLGSATGAVSHGDFAGITMNTASARVNVQNAEFRFVQAMAAVSGLGQMELKGPATLTTDSTNSIDVPVFGTGILTKQGSGLLSLTAANTYTGDTVVAGGTLAISSAFLADAANVLVGSGAILRLNFSGTDTISQLWLGGVQMPAGLYDTTNSLGYLTGTGQLLVTSAVPEPRTAALLALAGLGVAVAARRRCRAPR